ncbi:MAG: two-component regulator propeller domain-containing protein [Bacteroidota bacterium]
MKFLKANHLIRYITTCILFWQISVGAQPSIPFFRIGTAQGLSQSTVFCSFQDSRGFIWFGTAEGLNRYDGYGFKIFRHVLNDKNSLSSNDILSINEDADGNIWVGTRTRGLSILNIRTLKFDNSINIQKGINTSNSTISSIIKDRKNNIWFSAIGVGVFKQNFITKRIIKLKATGTENVSSGFIDKEGNLWYGNSTMQLIKFESENKAKLFSILKAKNQQNSYISAIAEAASGTIYATTNSNGLFSFDEKSEKFENIYYKPEIIDGLNNMKSIVCNEDNTLFITTNDGLLVVNNENFENVIQQKANSSKRFALSTHALMSLMIDKNQNLWIGSWEGGINVNYKKQPTFSLLRKEIGAFNSPLDRKITSVAASNELIWMGTNIGLSEFNKKTQNWRHFNQEQMSGADINVLKYDLEGDLFISAYQKNLTIFNQKSNSFSQFKIKNLKYTTSISAFTIERNGKMWVGTTNSGVFLFDKTTGEFEPLSKKVPTLNLNASISTLLQDNRNRLWIGTTASGLYVVNLNNNTFKTYKNGIDGKHLSDEHILAILQDKKSRIWIGTNGGGLNLFNDKEETFTTFSEQNGLPNNTIKSIVEDDNRNLWLSTNQGICNFNYDENTYKSYNEADGLQGKEFGRGVGTKNEEGELFFGGSNGLTYFNPNDLLAKPTQSLKIIFTDLKLFNKSVEIGKKNSPLKTDISLAKEIILKNSQSVFTLDFLALDFQQLKNYQYAYKLEGFDKDWNYIDNQRNASYTNMPEGTYYFKVKATNNEGNWTENISTLKITILPPWYRTVWAYLAYIILLVLSLYIWRRIIRMRERLQSDIRIQRIESQKIRELDIAKTNFFTNISHEFRTPLTLIISPIQQLLSSFEIGSEELDKQHNLILKNAQRLLRLINQILDISKLEAGNMKLEVSKNDLVEFLSSIALSFKVLSEKNNITYNIDIKNTIRYCFFDKDIVEKITYNLLSNAFKFTPENGQIDFKIEIRHQNLKLEVIDNGIGMDAETTKHIFERYFQADGKKERKSIGTGIGLALTKELTELHLGTIEVESAPHLGSRFTVEIPVTANKFDITQIKENFDFHFEPDVNFMKPSKIPNQEIVLENDAPMLLIVEDNDELREYLVGIFENKYKIIEAGNGQMGLKLAIENMPDVILSDYIMPIMDGGEFCKAIKTDEKTSHIPFVILTSKQNNSSIHNSYEIGADDYIIKPFNVAILTKKIESIIRAQNILKLKFGKAIDLIPENILQNQTEENFFKKAINIIENNIEDPDFDVTQLEIELNMSKMQLYRKLKGVSNLAPNEFIRNIRLKKAALIMQNTSLNVSEIAYLVGFNDPAYFARCFRKEFGSAPSDFMNRKVS